MPTCGHDTPHAYAKTYETERSWRPPVRRSRRRRTVTTGRPYINSYGRLLEDLAKKVRRPQSFVSLYEIVSVPNIGPGVVEQGFRVAF